MSEFVKYLDKNVVESLRELGFRVNADGIDYEFEDTLLSHVFVHRMDIPSRAKTTPQILRHIMNKAVQAATVRGRMQLGAEIRKVFVSADVIH